MSREKQIEEMANVYYEAMLKARGTLGSMNEGAPKWYAKYLYEAGYRKQSEGEWLYSEIYCTYICSECEECAPVDDFREPRLTDFCPNCGAKMKGGAE